MRTAIAYYRISTKRQGRSHLGLDAQQAAVSTYCTANNFILQQEIEEVKSTRKHRPGLLEAFAICMAQKATLIVARLDRLGRDVEEIAHNVKLPVDIVVTDNPHANRFTIHILAAVAEEQRRTIGENTRAALQAAKRKGKKLGKNGKKLAKKNKREADAFAKAVLPIIRGLKGEGFTTIKAIAGELNNRKVQTFRKGARWHGASVHNVIQRIKI
jgi:DNA invertase Pin-like site-specific DNA recombinase